MNSAMINLMKARRCEYLRQQFEEEMARQSIEDLVPHGFCSSDLGLDFAKQRNFVAAFAAAEKNRLVLFERKSLCAQLCCARAAFACGTYAYFLKEYQKSCFFFKQCVELDRNLSDEACQSLGKSLQALNKIEEAIEAFSMSVSFWIKSEAKNPKRLVRARLDLAQACRFAHRYDEAIFQYHACLALEPNSFRVNFSLGKCLCEHNKIEQAIIAFTSCVSSRPGSPEAYLARALAQIQFKNFTSALFDLDQAIHMDHSFAAAYFSIAEIAYLYYYSNKIVQDIALNIILISLKACLFFEPYHYGAKKQFNQLVSLGIIVDTTTIIGEAPDYNGLSLSIHTIAHSIPESIMQPESALHNQHQVSSNSLRSATMNNNAPSSNSSSSYDGRVSPSQGDLEDLEFNKDDFFSAELHDHFP